MSLREIYRAKDGSLFKIKRLSQNPTFFRYEKLSEEEINELATITSELAATNVSPGDNPLVELKTTAHSQNPIQTIKLMYLTDSLT